MKKDSIDLQASPVVKKRGKQFKETAVKSEVKTRGRPKGSRNRVKEPCLDSGSPSKTHDGICELIKACSENGVVNFKMGEIEISFQADRPEFVHEQVAPAVFEPAELKKDGIQQSFEDVSEEIELLKITDPLRYEQLINSGEPGD